MVAGTLKGDSAMSAAIKELITGEAASSPAETPSAASPASDTAEERAKLGIKSLEELAYDTEGF